MVETIPGILLADLPGPDAISLLPNLLEHVFFLIIHLSVRSDHNSKELLGLGDFQALNRLSGSILASM